MSCPITKTIVYIITHVKNCLTEGINKSFTEMPVKLFNGDTLCANIANQINSPLDIIPLNNEVDILM